MNLRNLRLRATGFSPHEMFHTYKFRRCVSEAADEEDDTLLRRIEENDGIDDECRTTIDQFAEVQRSVRNAAEDNIAKEKHRQKKSFDLRTLNRGETVNLGRSWLVTLAKTGNCNFLRFGNEHMFLTLLCVRPCVTSLKARLS